MALTFIGWSSWEVKLALFEQLAMPPQAPRQPRTAHQQVGPPVVAYKQQNFRAPYFGPVRATSHAAAPAPPAPHCSASGEAPESAVKP